MSSSHMTSEGTMYVRKLGLYFDAMVYALYPNRYMLEDSHGVELRSYVNSLADWLAKGILLSQSLSRILISAEPLLSPKIKYGIGRKGSKYSLWARILDDIMICGTRAYYSIHREEFRARRMLDMEESERRGEIFVRMYLIPRLKKMSLETINRNYKNRLLKVEECNEERRVYHIVYEGLDKEIGCRPDMLAILLVHGKLPRTLVFEVADTDVITVIRNKHVIPRVLLYMMATYLYYGIPSVGVYVSLSPSSNPPALLFLSKGENPGKLLNLLDKIKELQTLSEPPKPPEKPPCGHCVYATVCRFIK